MVITHRELCEKAAKWLVTVRNWNYRCQYAVVEMKCSGREITDVFGLRDSKPVLLEIKVSRQDFLADAKKPHRTNSDGMGATRYYVCPKEIITKDMISNGWGLIYYSDSGFEVIKESEYFHKRDHACELLFMMSIIRRFSGNKKVLDFRTKSL